MNSKVTKKWEDRYSREAFSLEDFDGIKETFPNAKLFIYSTDENSVLKNIIENEYQKFVFAARKVDFPKDGFTLYFFRQSNDIEFQRFFDGMNIANRKDLWTHFGSAAAFMQTKVKTKKKKTGEVGEEEIPYDSMVQDALKVAKRKFDELDTPTKRCCLDTTPLIQVIYMNGHFYAK